MSEAPNYATFGGTVEEFVSYVKNDWDPKLPPQIDRAQRRFATAADAQRFVNAHFSSGGGGAEVPLPQCVRRLYSQPFLAQRSPQWFEARSKCLTASDFAGAIGVNRHQTPRAVILKKTRGSAPFDGNNATRYGVEHEDRAVHRYERDHGCVVLDFGLLSHWTLFENKRDDETPEQCFARIHADDSSTAAAGATAGVGAGAVAVPPTLDDWRWLKGSPDGAAIHPVRDDDGVIVAFRAYLIEVKCPVRNYVPQFIAQQYYPQVQLLMELMDLDAAHFVQYQAPTLGVNERFDVLLVARNRDWMSTARRIAAPIWDGIMLRRRVAEAANADADGDDAEAAAEIECCNTWVKNQSGELVRRFPAYVIADSKKKELDTERRRVEIRVDRLQFRT